ncbi:poly [ADP-ribose] polymerase tankyrase isoform X2 [Nematostella vectensis]|uniref:poly [ADP-ribose] polymerase tankyrase isoform X2 n=1 Tax=Nematostella vectensis TaxID=45351 RepID=UPI0020771BBA|nr:poly [ADP-ribose] polymerase tankyrase isoform X2 [Nematostella vectensis]
MTVMEEAERVLAAARDGDIQTLKTLRRFVPFATDNYGSTVLHHATKHGKLDCVRWMVEKVGLDPKAKSKTGATALHVAAAQGKLQGVKFYIDECGVDPNFPDNSRHTALHLASRFGHYEVVKWLVEKANCDPGAKTLNRMSAIHFAASGGDLHCLKLLVNKVGNSSVNESATDGTTPLYLAAQDGNFDCLKFLHGVGAKCNITSRDGMHPIHAAAQNGHLDCLGYLAIHGRVSMTERDRTGATPAHYAAGQGHLSVLKWLNVRCDVKIKDSLGGTPLHDAAEKGQLHCLRFLVEVVHLDVRSKDSSNTSPIDLAERYGHVTCHEYMKTAHAKNLKQKAETVKEYTPFDTWTVDSASAGASFLHVLKRTPSKASLVPPPPATAKAPSIAPLSCSPCPTPKPPRTSNSVLNVPIARFEFVPLADTNTVLSEPTTRSDSVPSADEHNKPEPSSPKVISEVSMQNAVNVKKFQIESKINDDVLDAARKRTMFLKRSTEVYSRSDTSSPVTSPSDKLDSRRGSVEFKNAITSARSNLKSSLSRNSSKSEDNLYKIEDEELNITERKVPSSENMDGNPVEKKENVVSVETKKATNENAIQDVASEKFFTEQEDRFQESESTSYSDKPFMIENTAREQIFKQQLESKVAPSNGTHPNGGSPVSPLSSITTQMLKRPLRERQMVAMPHMGESAEDNDGMDEDTWRTLPEWKRQVLKNRIMKQQQEAAELQRGGTHEVRKPTEMENSTLGKTGI